MRHRGGHKGSARAQGATRAQGAHKVLAHKSLGGAHKGLLHKSSWGAHKGPAFAFTLAVHIKGSWAPCSPQRVAQPSLSVANRRPACKATDHCYTFPFACDWGMYTYIYI